MQNNYKFNIFNLNRRRVINMTFENILESSFVNTGPKFVIREMNLIVPIYDTLMKFCT